MLPKSGFKKTAAAGFIILMLICIPAATWLQARAYTADPHKNYDAVYLVCGARAQNERIDSLSNWLKEQAADNLKPAVILIGSDPQKSFWCRLHQTNHTVSVWSKEKLDKILKTEGADQTVTVIPGKFSTTDGEMIVLADYLAGRSQIKTIALATSPYHARRSLQRLRAHAAENISISIIPAAPSLKNRNPLRVVIEYLKILRDKAGLSDAPIISRPQKQ